MSEPARYHRAEQLTRSGQITTSRGVDAVTGLGVLIYDFPGAPRTKPGQLESEAIPTVLAAGYDGTNGVLVSVYPQGASQLVNSGVAVDDSLVLQALAALRDAARVGLAHGDITPERFLLAHNKVYVEGYGVPWQPENLSQPNKEALQAALARDLVSAVKALLNVGSANTSSEVASALKGAVGSATRSTDARQLYSVVRRLAGGAVTVPPAGFGNLVLPTDTDRKTRSSATALDDIGLGHLDLDLDKLDLKPKDTPPLDAIDNEPVRSEPERFSTPLKFPGEPTLEDPAATEDSSGPFEEAPLELFDEAPAFGHLTDPDPPAVLTTPPFPDEPEPIVLQSDPGPTMTVDSRLKDSGAGFVKDLPPGATYRAGNVEEDVRVPPMDLNINAVPKRPKRQWRLPLLVLALVLVAGAAGYMALVSMRETPTAAPGTSAMSHFVDVRVDPPNLPPASLVVEQRPAASAFRSGTIIASVPRRVRFDAAGVWVVHASFQGRVSESVTITVPNDTAITIVFPPEEQP